LQYAGRESPIVKRLESVETVLIVVALVSLWPLLLRFSAPWYQLWLAAVLGAMVWVAVRRFRRIREAAEEAKRKRDEIEKPGPPPFLTG
jgi:membrane protein implicated in regulation of membrane protease activity